MPELPEVETVRRTLAARVLGMRIGRVEVRRPDVVEGWSPTCEASELLEGTTIRALLRHGKQLAILGGAGESENQHTGAGGASGADSRAIVVQLGMTGQLVHRDRESAKVWLASTSHVHVVWHLERVSDTDADGPSQRGSIGDGGVLAFRDPRRFGGVWIGGPGTERLEARWAALGPDGVGLTGAQLRDGTRGSARAIKAALLDQAVVAGVGNIYADESLHRAGIRPQRACRRLTRGECERLALAIREVLALAIEARGSTLRDYVDGEGARGEAQFGHRVYGRGGEPCLECGLGLKSRVLAQRTTVWCARCQR